MKKRLSVFFFFLSFVLSSYSQSVQKTLVYFDFDKYDLTKETTHKLDSMAKFMTKYADKVLKIEIAGHCDAMGDYDYNDVLSDERAKEIRNYLVSKGVKDTLIKRVDAFGKRKPINNNSDSLERALNRRVEITSYFLRNNAAKSPPPSNQTNDKPKRLIPKSDDLTKIGELDSNSTIIIPNLNFYKGMHKLMPTSNNSLVMLYKILRENPTYKIELDGHICCQPEWDPSDAMDFETGDQNLSLNRAKAVYDYLIRNGIDANRLSYKGFGSRVHLVPEITEDDELKNRRVEIRLISK
jgi:outer membrane protein OmpA-like peptidoglycan-associated protein